MKIDGLYGLTTAYLLLPGLLFAGGWVTPVAAVPLVAATGVAVVVSWQRRSVPTGYRHRWQEVLILGALALFLCAMAGIGGLTEQKSDYVKHNLLLHDLVRYPHPVEYANAAYADPFLCYSLAHYLPPAVVAKGLGGVSGAALLAFAWGTLGVWLVLAWLRRLGGRVGWWLCGGFFLVGGLDLFTRWYWIWQTLYAGEPGPFWQEFVQAKGAGVRLYIPPSVVLSDGDYRHRLEFPPVFSQLQWAPQHALGGWLLTALLLHHYRVRRLNAVFWVTLGQALFWSPFMAVGLLPLLGVLLGRVDRRTWYPLGLLAGAAWVVLFLAYFEAHLPVGGADWVLRHLRGGADVGLYVVFLVFSFGLLGFVLVQLERRYRLLEPWRPLVFAALGSLLVLTAVCVGEYNDFLLRSVIPGQFVLAFALLFALGRARQRRLRSGWLVGLIGCLAVGAYYPLQEIVRGIPLLRKAPGLGSVAEATRTFPDLSRMDGSEQHNFPLSTQYLGRRDSFFGTYLIHSTSLP